MSSDPKSATVGSVGDLENILGDNNIQSLHVEVPLSQEVFEKLSNSPLGKSLEELDIQPEYEDDNPPMINTAKTSFPALKRISINCQAVHAFHFEKEFFPELESISIESPCAEDLKYFKCDLPKLSYLSFQFVTIEDAREFGPSLSKCRELETVVAYKLWGLSSCREILLVMPKLTLLDLYRSDDLPRLQLWAPKLRDLDLRACFSCPGVSILKNLPRGYKEEEYNFEGEESKMTVNIINTSLNKNALLMMDRVAHVIQSEEDDEDGEDACVLS